MAGFDHAERLNRLRAVLPRLAEASQVKLDDDMAEFYGEPNAAPPRVRGPCRCAACGDVRVREAQVELFPGYYPYSFFDSGWPNGDIQPGTRIACDLTWLAEDRDRCAFVRLRHPVPEDSLTLLGSRTGRGCPCGTGLGVFVLHFVREPAALTLSALELRVVRSLADLVDIDFAQCLYRTRDLAPGAKPRRTWSRAEALRWILRELA